MHVVSLTQTVQHSLLQLPPRFDGESERESENFICKAGTQEGQPPIYAGAYVTVHNNAHIERKNKQTNNIMEICEQFLKVYRNNFWPTFLVGTLLPFDVYNYQIRQNNPSCTVKGFGDKPHHQPSGLALYRPQCSSQQHHRNVGRRMAASAVELQLQIPPQRTCGSAFRQQARKQRTNLLDAELLSNFRKKKFVIITRAHTCAQMANNIPDTVIRQNGFTSDPDYKISQFLKKCSERRKYCSMAVVKGEPKIFAPLQTFAGAQDGQNLIS